MHRNQATLHGDRTVSESVGGESWNEEARTRQVGVSLSLS